MGHSVLIVDAAVQIHTAVTEDVCCISRWKQGMLGSVYGLFSCQSSGCINLRSWWAAGSCALQFWLICFIVRLGLPISRSLSLSLPVFSFALTSCFLFPIKFCCSCRPPMRWTGGTGTTERNICKLLKAKNHITLHSCGMLFTGSLQNVQRINDLWNVSAYLNYSVLLSFHSWII